ncbi:MAG: hypothetical protein GTO02_13320 [Candidatus Dadabacteria bacterium]|nr:hypothetical protein [Candidatus Dadabacteria bacterium]NIQ15326.1 hypothetical protein [Candidatus Dadabacteria bacterium]
MNKKKKNKKNSFSILTVVIFTLFLVISLSYVRIKIEQIKIGYEISKNKRSEQSLLKERQLAKANLMKLKSLDRLEPYARNMGFKFPTHDDVVFIDKVTVVGKRR